MRLCGGGSISARKCVANYTRATIAVGLITP